jgi:hypothetical protein
MFVEHDIVVLGCGSLDTATTLSSLSATLAEAIRSCAHATGAVAAVAHSS